MKKANFKLRCVFFHSLCSTGVPNSFPTVWAWCSFQMNFSSKALMQSRCFPSLSWCAACLPLKACFFAPSPKPLVRKLLSWKLHCLLLIVEVGPPGPKNSKMSVRRSAQDLAHGKWASQQKSRNEKSLALHAKQLRTEKHKFYFTPMTMAMSQRSQHWKLESAPTMVLDKNSTPKLLCFVRRTSSRMKWCWMTLAQEEVT